MKKALASILLLTYFVVSSGVIINFHYCMDRLASTQFFGAETKVCGKCGMHTGKSHGCCHDEVKVVKLSVDQQKAQVAVYSLAAPVAIIAPLSSFMYSPLYITNEELLHHVNHSPPLLGEQDTYLQNGVFRI